MRGYWLTVVMLAAAPCVTAEQLPVIAIPETRDAPSIDGVVADGEPLASLRLALLRDGLEDYELMARVRALATGRGDLAARARRLLMLDAPLITSLTEYTQDGALLLERRQAILEVGEALAQHESGP